MGADQQNMKKFVGICNIGERDRARSILMIMEEKRLVVDALKRCKTIKQLHQVHAYATATGILYRHASLLLPNILFTITLLLPAAADGAPSSSSVSGYAVSVFNRIQTPTTFSYNTLIRAHTLLSSPMSGLLLFLRMRRLSVPPDFHTYPFAIKAAGHLGSFAVAAACHSEAFKLGFASDLFVLNSLVHVYSVSLRMDDASRLFEESGDKDVVSYNALIDGFVKAGEIGRARELFDKMPERDVVSWGTLVAGYARMNQCREAIELFNSMSMSMSLSPDRCSPDSVAIVSVLSACGQLGDLEQGIAVHDYIIGGGIKMNAFLSTALVDFYSKCGCLQKAVDVFEGSSDKNLFTWNAMLIGLAMHGDGKTCLDYFSRMLDQDGVKPDGVSFLGVLVGCSHSGMVHEARALFESMEEDTYRVPRELKHYGCMADLLGRAGLIKEAVEMIERMPVAGDVYVWGGLLAGCSRAHGGMVDIAKEAAKQVHKLKPGDGGVYSLMANVYANAELWDDLVQTRNLIKKVKRNAGCSLIKLNGVTHEFIAGDDLHPRNHDIFMVLNGLSNHLSQCS
ncbi:hypothetical protein Dimus_021020 [Dionaea muscipula]